MGATKNRIINFVCLCATMELVLHLFFPPGRNGAKEEKADKNPLIVSIRISFSSLDSSMKFISLRQYSTYSRMNKRFEGGLFNSKAIKLRFPFNWFSSCLQGNKRDSFMASLTDLAWNKDKLYCVQVFWWVSQQIIIFHVTGPFHSNISMLERVFKVLYGSHSILIQLVLKTGDEEN